jgi:hypothetical protein
MPKKMERKLKSEARKKFGTTKSKRAAAYIYGTMRKTGWKPSHQRKRGR